MSTRRWRQLTARGIRLVLLLVAFVACGGKVTPQTDLKTIEGTWVGTITDPTKPGDPEPVTWTFKGTQLTITNPPGSPAAETQYAFTADATGSPKWLELTGDQTIHASYRLNGDELVVWHDPKPGEPRPFYDENQPGQVVIRLKRK